MTKVITKAMLARFKRIQDKLSKDRDELRDFLDEVEALDGDVSDAAESLEYAAEALSRLI